MEAKRNLKIYIVRSSRPNPWVSMGIIESSILDSLTIDPAYATQIIDENMRPADIAQIRRDTEEHECFLFFLSENLQIEKIIIQLSAIEDLKFIIPIYGNMTIETKRWMQLDVSLRGRGVYFLGASTRHCQQIRRLALQPTVVRLPYPLSPAFLTPVRPSSDERIRLIYAGRITPQKNVLPLMEAFIKASTLNPRLELHLAGSFHHVGYHFHGHIIDPANFERRFYELLALSKGRILYHKQLDQTALSLLYDESDYFVTMSTHHDEDFGMSLAQAIARGLKGIASDWGGHADFARIADVALIPVSIDEMNIPNISMKKLFLHLASIEEKISRALKQSQQAAAMKNFQQKTYQDQFYKMLDIQPNAYLGQTDVFKDYARLSEDNYVFNPSTDHLFGGNSIYERIYSSYLSDEPHEDFFFPIQSE